MLYDINITYPVIAVVCYLAVELIKKTPLRSEFYPAVSCILGAILGGLGNIFFPEMIAAENIVCAIINGALCGLAATGGNQIYKKAIELLKGDNVR